MNEPNTIYTLNNECIVDSLTADIGVKQPLAVPHLSVLKKVNDDLERSISCVSSYLSGAIGNLDYSAEIGTGYRISSITQTSGKVNIGTSPFSVADISAVAIVENDFLKTFSERKIKFEYDETNHVIFLGLTKYDDKSKMLSIDCNDFIKDGMLSNVINGNDEIMGPYIEFVWNTDGGSKKTRLYVKEILGGIYKGVSPIVVDQNSLSISLDINALKSTLRYNELYSYYQFLAGLGEWADKGAIKTLSDDVQTLLEFGVKDLKYVGHIDDPENLSTKTLVEYFGGHLVDLTSVYNGTFLPVTFKDNKIKVSTTDVEKPLVVGNGDIVIIHDHGNKLSIDVEDLKVGTNVFVIKAGVSRYEFEKNVDDTSYISNWIDSNFKNFDDKDSELIETKKGISSEYVYVDHLSASNLKAEVTSLISVDSTPVAKIITGIGEENGIIKVSSDILQTTMISGLRQELDNLSCTVTICSALSDFEKLSSYGGNNGDIAILSVKLGTNPLSSGYSVTGYTWRKDISAWAALNGNYNAKNIYFDYDIIEAGSWTGVGNISHTANTVSSINSTDKSLAEVMDMIFKGEETFPKDMTIEGNKLSCGISQTSQYVEVGENVTPKFTISFDKKTYTYGSNTNIGPNTTTGVNPTTYTLTYKDKDNNLSVKTGTYTTSITANGSFVAKAGTNSSGGSLSVNYAAAAANTYIPRTSLGRVLSASGEGKYRVTSGTAKATSTTNSIVGYYPNLYGFASLDNDVFKTGDDIDYSYLSALTRESTSPDVSTGMVNPLSSLTPPSSWLHFFYALPSNHPKKLTGVKIKSSEAPFDLERKSDTVIVPFKNSVTKEYKVFFIRLVSPAGNAEVALTWEPET